MIYIFRHALLKTYLCISLIVLISFLCLETKFFQEKWIKKTQTTFRRRYMKLVYYSFLRLSFTFLCIFFEARNENILVMKGGNRIDAYKGFSSITRIR